MAKYVDEVGAQWIINKAISEDKEMLDKSKTYTDSQLQGKASKATTLSGYGITNAYTKQEVDGELSAIDGEIDTLNTKVENITKVKTFGGSKAVAELTQSLLIADNEGKIYNVTDNGVTTSLFVEGAGIVIAAGSDVAVVNARTVANPLYRFNLMGAPTVIETMSTADVNNIWNRYFVG